MNTLPIKLPDVGEGVTEAELVEWHVKVGDLVREDDILAEVMTDKATVEIPSLYDGKIVKCAGEIGSVLPIGTDLVWIETDAEGPAEAATERAAPTPKPDRTHAVVETDTPKQPVVPSETPAPAFAAQPPRKEGAPVLASPAVRARARRAGIDLRQVPGTGPAGRVRDSDVDAFLSQGSGGRSAPARGKRQGVTEIKVAGLRRRIAERMALANTQIPHITVIEEVDVTALEDLRGKLNDDRQEKPKLTILPLLCAALTKAIGDHPEMNAHFDSDAGVIQQHAPVHVGIATMTNAGLMVPVIRHAEALGIFDTAGEITRLSEAARSSSATRDELSGSTITITSLGPLGAIATTPIINHPEVAIVGVNKKEVRPHWDGTQFVPREKMNLSASFDHRVIDGWDAAVFVQKMKTLLETPALIFMET